jgi:hypothetical protein
MKEIAKAFKKAIMDEFDGYLKTVGFQKIRHHADKLGFSIIYRCGESYITFDGRLHPRDCPFIYSISFGEGSNDFPESDWNAIPIFLIIKSESLTDFEKCKEIFSIEYKISRDEITQKIKASRELLEKYGKPFLSNDLDKFRKLRAEQNKDRGPYKIYSPQEDGKYKMEYEKQSNELKEKYSK